MKPASPRPALADLDRLRVRLLHEKALPRFRAIRSRIRQRIREGHERYALAARGAVDGLWDWNIKTGEVYYSERWKSALGFDNDEIGSTIREWLERVHRGDIAPLKHALDMHLQGETPHFEAEYRMAQHDSAYRWMFARGIALRDGAGLAYRMAGSQTDINERKMAVEELLRSASHDGLTGLPNRMLFMDRLHSAIARARRREAFTFAVLFLDLDRFKVINDTLGHMVGDQLLIEVSARLQRSLRPGDTLSRGNASSPQERTLARLGGDEFTILLEDIRGEIDAIRIAERIEKEFARPFLVGGRETYTSASIGIAVSTTGFEGADDLIRDADTAMYLAKRLGRARFELCNREMHESILATLELENDLHAAIDRGELVLRYQPIVSLPTGKIAGFEALVRWQHPRRGLLGPSEFIHVAEESGLIRDVGEWVARQACRDVAAWNGKQNDTIWVSINVSARQLVMTEFANTLQRILREQSIDPSRLKVEVTESAIIANAELAAQTLDALKGQGVRICIDDFGTGYSSFANLMTYPVDTLKIDQSFVMGMEPGNRNWRLVETMIPLAEILGKDTVAEGVQHPDHLAQLRKLGCDYGQGYLFSRPIEIGEAEELLASGPTW